VPIHWIYGVRWIFRFLWCYQLSATS
jgi:hypothetical protein